MRPSAKMKPQTKGAGQSGRTVEAPLTPGWPAARAPVQQVEEVEDDEPVDDGSAYVAAGAPQPPRRGPPLKAVIEAYFDDQSLKQDRYLSDLIAESPGGWVDIDIVLGLRRVRALKAKRDDTLRALRGSQQVEVWHDPADGSAAIRRPKGRAPPAYDPTAAQPVDDRRGAAAAAPGAGAGGEKPRGKGIFPGRLNGTVAEYDEEMCVAKIACPQTHALFQQHVLAEWTEVENAAVNIGSPVSFLVELGPGGEPLARELQLRAPDVIADDEDDDYVRPAKRRRPRPQPQAEVKPGNRYVGKIKSFHDGLGLGFIACRPTFCTFGRDIAIGQAELGSFMVGDYASFELAVDETFGTPKGIALQEAYEADADQLVVEATAPRPAARPSAKAADAAICAGLAGRRFVGVVKSIDEVSAMGMIECDETYETLACDITVDGDELSGFEVGDGVGFYVRGTRAVDLEAEEAPDPAVVVAPGKGKAKGKGRGRGKSNPQIGN